MIDPANIDSAVRILTGKIDATPLMESRSLSNQFGGPIYLKMENLQRTGSFKIRGALYKLTSNQDAIGPQGVVAASAGNHAQGVALAASQLGIGSTIVMPEGASITKQQATHGYGGRIILHGQSVDDALSHARSLAASGAMLVHPFDDDDIITGQGTIGVEIIDALPDVDTVVVPIGGGGLISGIASAIKARRPKIRVIGVQAASCPSSQASLAEGKPVRVSATASIADGIVVKQPGDRTFAIIRRLVDEVVLVSEEQIAAAMLLLLERKKMLVEGSGAAPLAALLAGEISVESSTRTVLVISGGNVDIPLLGRIIKQGLMRSGRIMHLQLQLADEPGSLAGLLEQLAVLKVNVLHIRHHRNLIDLPVYTTRVALELETRDPDHAAMVMARLEQSGYVIESCQSG